jgi:ABC-type sugar transport system ATPase subunit
VLYSHRTVEQNICFPLQLADASDAKQFSSSAEQQNSRTAEQQNSRTADMLDLDDYLESDL